MQPNMLRKFERTKPWTLSKKPDTKAQNLALKTKHEGKHRVSASVLVKQELCKSSLQNRHPPVTALYCKLGMWFETMSWPASLHPAVLYFSLCHWNLTQLCLSSTIITRSHLQSFLCSPSLAGSSPGSPGWCWTGAVGCGSGHSPCRSRNRQYWVHC